MVSVIDDTWAVNKVSWVRQQGFLGSTMVRQQGFLGSTTGFLGFDNRVSWVRQQEYIQESREPTQYHQFHVFADFFVFWQQDRNGTNRTNTARFCQTISKTAILNDFQLVCQNRAKFVLFVPLTFLLFTTVYPTILCYFLCLFGNKIEEYIQKLSKSGKSQWDKWDK